MSNHIQHDSTLLLCSSIPESTDAKGLLDCPLCDDLAGNTSKSKLSIHLYTAHYSKSWDAQYDALDEEEKDLLEYQCEKCPQENRKRITGATTKVRKTENDKMENGFFIMVFVVGR